MNDAAPLEPANDGTVTLPAPPLWAAALLRLVTRRADYERVSGVLLEAYEARTRTPLGAGRADRWYVSRVLALVVRASGPWAALFAAVFLGRTALDWRVPPADFTARALVTTCLAASILLCAGFIAAWRSGSIGAGTFVTVASVALAAPIVTAGAALLLAVWNDAGTMAAIESSGGLGEVFTLPWIGLLPGAILGTAGGAAGAALSRLRSH